LLGSSTQNRAISLKYNRNISNFLKYYYGILLLIYASSGSQRSRLDFKNKEKEVGITADIQLQHVLAEQSAMQGNLKAKRDAYRNKFKFKKKLKKKSSDPDIIKKETEEAEVAFKVWDPEDDMIEVILDSDGDAKEDFEEEMSEEAKEEEGPDEAEEGVLEEAMGSDVSDEMFEDADGSE